MDLLIDPLMVLSMDISMDLLMELLMNNWARDSGAVSNYYFINIGTKDDTCYGFFYAGRDVTACSRWGADGRDEKVL